MSDLRILSAVTEPVELKLEARSAFDIKLAAVNDPISLEPGAMSRGTIAPSKRVVLPGPCRLPAR